MEKNLTIKEIKKLTFNTIKNRTANCGSKIVQLGEAAKLKSSTPLFNVHSNAASHFSYSSGNRTGSIGLRMPKGASFPTCQKSGRFILLKEILEEQEIDYLED